MASGRAAEDDPYMNDALEARRAAVQAELAAHLEWSQRAITVEDGKLGLPFSAGDPQDYLDWHVELGYRYDGMVRRIYVQDTPGAPSLAELRDHSVGGFGAVEGTPKSNGGSVWSRTGRLLTLMLDDSAPAISCNGQTLGQRSKDPATVAQRRNTGATPAGRRSTPSPPLPRRPSGPTRSAAGSSCDARPIGRPADARPGLAGRG
jgi:hypothetical protein